jgi:hypothetical protein
LFVLTLNLFPDYYCCFIRTYYPNSEICTGTRSLLVDINSFNELFFISKGFFNTFYFDFYPLVKGLQS